MIQKQVNEWMKRGNKICVCAIDVDRIQNEECENNQENRVQKRILISCLTRLSQCK